MLVGASYTLYRMRKNLAVGIRRGVADLRKSAGAAETTERTERDLNFKVALMGIGATLILMVAVYNYFTGAIGPALFAAIIMPSRRSGRPRPVMLTPQLRITA